MDPKIPLACRYGALVILLALAGPAPARDEPIFAKPALLTADALVDLVLERNPGIQAMRAAAEVAVHRIAPAGALDDPMVSYALAPTTLGESRGLLQRFELSQPLPWPGKLDLRESAARHLAAAAAEEIGELRLQIAEKARALFAEWAFVHRAAAINDAHQGILGDLRRVAESRYATGRGLQQDALQAEVARARIGTEALGLERRRAEVRASLNALLNRAVGESIPDPSPLPDPTELPRGEVLASHAVAHHPSLRRLQARIGAAQAEVGLARKEFYPDFRLSGGYNDLWDERAKRWTLGVSVNLPFDLGGKRSAAANGAAAELLRARWQLTDAEAQLLAELEMVRARIGEARAVIAVYVERLLPLAAESLDAAVADYSAGAGPFLSIIDAERQQLRTEEALARARSDYWRGVAALERSVGGSLPDTTAPALPPGKEFSR